MGSGWFCFSSFGQGMKSEICRLREGKTLADERGECSRCSSLLLRQVVTLLDPNDQLLEPPPVLEPPLLEPLEPSLPLLDQLEMLDPLLVEVDLDLLLLLRY
ncbi:hypothetical protein Peur_029107 [Populus x canadensis]